MMRAALVVIFAALGLGLSAQTGSAAVWVSSDGPRQLTMQDSNPAARLDLRLHEYRLAFGSNGRRLLVGKLLSGTFEIASDEVGGCRYGRAPGRTRSSPAGIDRKRVECDLAGVESLFVGGGTTTDWVCVIEPSAQRFELDLDVHTQANHDSIAGGHGNDELNGGSGNDILIGRDGNDQLFGYEFPADDFGEAVATDDDHLFGGFGSDSIWGGPKADTIIGGPDADPVLCGTDSDDDLGGPPECDDHWGRDAGVNRFFSAEGADLDLETGLPAPTTAARDRVDCNGVTEPATTRYDAGLDVMVNCPTVPTATSQPPQHGGTYAIPKAVRSLKTCPPLRG